MTGDVNKITPSYILLLNCIATVYQARGSVAVVQWNTGYTNQQAQKTSEMINHAKLLVYFLDI